MNWTKHSWHRLPSVRSGDELTLGERAADRLRNTMGSWVFVFSFLGLMLAWGLVNSSLADKLIGGAPFDPFPWILLNLGLSMIAGLQGAILLIAAKRSDQISSELALHDYQVNKASLAYHVNVSAAILAICTELNVDLPDEVQEILLNPKKIPVPISLD